MSSKTKYAQRAQEMAGVMSRLVSDIEQWKGVYWDRGYNSGGADVLVDADVESLGLTAADVTGLVTFSDALDTFMAANRAYLSKVRNDL